MDQATRFISLGKQFLRTFIAFIVSYYVVFVQLWLAIELFNLAQELARAGQEYGVFEFKRASKQLMGARAAAFAAFFFGVIATVMTIGRSYLPYYGGYSYSILTQLLYVLPVIRMIPVIIELGMLIGAWHQINKFFALTDSPATREVSRGLKSSARVRWALVILLIATVLRLAMSSIYSPNNYGYNSYYDYYPYVITSIVPLIGVILMLLGSANAGTGWYDTSKVFRRLYTIHEKRPLPQRLPDRDLRVTTPRQSYRELPFHPDNLASQKRSTEQTEAAPSSENYSAEMPVQQEKMKYCYNCGKLLPEVAGLRFCPDCGIRVN